MLAAAYVFCRQAVKYTLLKEQSQLVKLLLHLSVVILRLGREYQLLRIRLNIALNNIK